jgi:hypothetical protein
MHGLLGVLSPINIMCKPLQSACSRVCDDEIESDKAISTLQRECIENADSAGVAAPGCSGGKHFAALVSNNFADVGNNFSVQFLERDDACVSKALSQSVIRTVAFMIT